MGTIQNVIIHPQTEKYTSDTKDSTRFLQIHIHCI
jgi:hypothetical protein